MKTGDLVMVTGGYFKYSNGMYIVAHSPQDPGWTGMDYALQRVSKTGKIQKGYQYWPLLVTINGRTKREEVEKWNRENAKIEVMDWALYSMIAENADLYFYERAEEARKSAKFYQEHGFSEEFISIANRDAKFLEAVRGSIAKEVNGL